MTSVNDRIIARLEEERHKRKMKKRGFSALLEMAPYTYLHLVEGHSHITAERLYEVAQILGIPIIEFYEGDE